MVFNGFNTIGHAKIESESCQDGTLRHFLKLAGFHRALGPISLTDLSPFLGLNLTQSDSWLSLSLFMKLTPERAFFHENKRAKNVHLYPCSCIYNIMFPDTENENYTLH